MGKTLVIAEKPMAGADMARILGCTERKTGYIEGSRYIVTWALGHLVGQKLPEEHNQEYKAWRIDDLPFNFNLRESLKVLPDTAAQFRVIKELINRTDVELLINAGDAGREGYLIQEWIYRMAGNKKPKKVLWASSLTDEALKKAFGELKEPGEFEGLLREAECRAQLDYLLGINYSRALSIKNTMIVEGKRAVLHYGRCQTPLLRLIADRDREIKEFVEQPYYEVKVSYKSGFSGVLVNDSEMKQTRKFKTQDEAAAVIDSLSDAANVISCISTEKNQMAPSLFNLAGLQKEMGKKFGYAPDETLSIAQGLYEKKKVLSYPRTDSCYLSTDVFHELHEHLNSVRFGKYAALLEGMEKPCLDKRYVNDLKVSDHHALIPTIHPDMEGCYASMTDAEKNVFDAVIRQFIAVFYPPYRYQATEIVTGMSDYVFLTRGTTVISPGYRAVLQEEEGTEPDEERQQLPVLNHGELLSVATKELISKKTKALAAYTVSSIIDLMEKYNIGTSATRSEIIKKLLGGSAKGNSVVKAFIKLEKGSYSATELGVRMIDLVPEALKNPELTNHYEKVLEQINAGSITTENFLREIIDEQRKTIESFETKKTEIEGSGSFLKCPLCGKSVIENSKAYSCSGWSEGCDFKIWKVIGGKAITRNQAEALLTKGRTGKISGFKKKGGGTYSAYLVLQDGKTGFIYTR